MLPVAGAVEAYLVIFHNLPFSVKAFINLALFFPVVAGVIRMVLDL